MAVEVPGQPGRSARELLRDRDFGPYFAGNLVSNSGTWFQNIAAILLIHDLTGSATMVGLVTGMQFGAALVLSVWSGALADRYDRRHLMIIGQLCGACSAVALAVLAITGLSPVVVLALVALAGIGQAITSPAMQASIPALVRPADIAQAVALQSLTFNLARAIGPAGGAVVYAIWGPATSFTLNAMSYFFFLAVLLRLTLRPGRTEGEPDRSVLGGFRYVRARPAILACIFGVGSLGFGADPVNTLSPELAILLGRGEVFVGVMVTTFGVGATLAVPLVARLRSRLPVGVVAPTSLLTLAASMALLSVSTEPAVALFALVAGGGAYLTGVSDLTATVHASIDEQFRGRVMAIWGMAFLGVRPLAAVAHGALGDLYGARPATLLATVVCLASAVYVRRSTRGQTDPGTSVA